MKNIEGLVEKIIAFRDARDWGQFNNPKDNAISLVLEASEVMEHFQWKNNEEILKYVSERKSDIAEELADVLYWVLLMAHDLEINILEAAEKKLSENEKKYPIESFKGKHIKYNQL